MIKGLIRPEAQAWTHIRDVAEYVVANQMRFSSYPFSSRDIVEVFALTDQLWASHRPEIGKYITG